MYKFISVKTRSHDESLGGNWPEDIKLLNMSSCVLFTLVKMCEIELKSHMQLLVLDLQPTKYP